MRYWILALMAVVSGTLFGVGITVMELGASLTSTVDASLPTKPAEISPDAPRVVADQEEYHFGSMERDSTKSHVFTIRNEGKSLLVLKKGQSTCRCTKFQIENTDLKPGESTTVAIDWHATVPPGSFRQSATIETNDPARPMLTFTIEGDVTTSIKVVPDELVFTAISLNEPHSADASIYSYRDGELKVMGYEFLESANTDKYEFRAEPMPADKVSEEKDAKTGVIVHVTVKPGLPLGAFRQKIKITLNENNEPVELPIMGNTVSDVTLAGPNWDEDRGLLTLGTFSSREGMRAELFILAHGPHRKQLHPTIKQINPDIMKVTFGEPVEGGADSLIRIPMTLEIPPGLQPMLHLGGQEGKLGEILINTSDPEAETIRVRVRFAIAE
jgi:hypothetical protein